jgi:hypothetical protein
MGLQGFVRVTNRSGEDYENAQTRLIVGRVHLLDEIARLARRQYPYDRPGERPTSHELVGQDGGAKDWFLAAQAGGPPVETQRQPGDIKEIIKEGLSEYFLYTIEGTETIADSWGKRLASFTTTGIPVECLHKYDEERWGQETEQFLSFANDREHQLGQTPLPDGQFRVFRQVDPQAHLAYVGATRVKYIPVDAEVELDLGPARLVRVEPKLMAVATENYLFDDDGGIAGWDELQTWQVEVANRRDLAVKVEITRGFATPCWALEAPPDQVRHDKHDARHARFTLDVEPQSTRTFACTVRIYHERRQEAFAPQP